MVQKACEVKYRLLYILYKSLCTMKNIIKYSFSFGTIVGLFVVVFLTSCSMNKDEHVFSESFPEGITRVWIGPQYWANRLQDWQVNQGRLECVTAQPNRNVNVLTWRLKKEAGDFVITFKTGLLSPELAGDRMSWVGLKIGARGNFNDYRDDAIYGKGLNAGITTAGELFIGDLPVKEDGNAKALIPYLKKAVVLKYELKNKKGQYNLVLSAIDPKTGEVLSSVEEKDIPQQQLHGAIALVSSFNKKQKNNEIRSCWFDDWVMKGSKLAPYPKHEYGPILFAQYTLGRNILKMNVQMPPVGEQDGKEVSFQIKKKSDEDWTSLQKASIDKDARTATFRIENWDDSKDVAYRLAYSLYTGNGKMKEYYRTGIIRKNPVEKEEFVLAAFTGNNDLGFPNNEVEEAIQKQNPDMLFFSGDQIYERVGGFGVQRAPVEKAILDYLRKWYVYGWEYGDLFRNRPVISITDDHDVYHGNIWGCGGKAAPRDKRGYEAQDAGGYKMPARWVKMVERTQTANLPDPYDPTPVEQGIGVYYTSLNYGGLSFAVVEDRKFKSAPKPLLPEANIVNGWAQNLNWDPVTQADVPEAKLLGDRQLEFLNHWVEDWSHGAKMKALLSATILENLATLPSGEHQDEIVPKLRILKEGEYPPDDEPVADLDSNGWPQTGRNKAVKIIRKAFAIHIAGDQHLASFTQYGVDQWSSGSFAFCVPSISNIWPRRWYPKEAGKNRKQGAPKYTGDFTDGFGNKMTVYAVANPLYTGKEPSRLYDRSTGYGIVVFNKKTREITSHCYPRFVDPASPTAKEYPGWPVTISQFDNYKPKIYGWLPSQKSEITDPVVKVFNEKTGELLYAVRIKGNTFNPPVFEEGSYRIEIGDDDRGGYKMYKGLRPVK